jgi:hypothetical protein
MIGLSSVFASRSSPSSLSIRLAVTRPVVSVSRGQSL